MTADRSGSGRAQDPLLVAAKRAADETLTDEDERVLRLWRENLVLQDPRYGSKALFTLAACAMADGQFRYRLVTDTQAILDELGVPEGITLRFFENTEGTLNVVLPPSSGEMSERPVSLRDELSSRTSSQSFL